MRLSSVIAGLSAAAVAFQGVAYAVQGPAKSLLRPPGAQGEADFSARCIKCGKCMEACPYLALSPAPGDQGIAAGTPMVDARAQACRLCEDFPCVEACPTNALRGIEGRSDVRMGTAVIDEDLCIAFQGMRCEVCYRTCPLIDQAISWAAACASSAAWWTSRTWPSASGPTPSIPAPAPGPSTANPFEERWDRRAKS